MVIFYGKKSSFRKYIVITIMGQLTELMTCQVVIKLVLNNKLQEIKHLCLSSKYMWSQKKN